MSADLFAAFDDFSQPPPQQSQSKPPQAQPPSAPLSFASPLNPTIARSSGHQSSQSFSASSQFQHDWLSPQPSPAFNTRPASIATSSFANNRLIHNDNTEDDDDGWGDFEVAPNTAPSPKPSQLASASPNPTAMKPPTPAPPTAGVRPQRARVVRASTLDMFSNNLTAYDESSALPSPQTELPKSKLHKMTTANADPNVLFDADDFDGEQDIEASDDEEDDFGEFETVAPQLSPDLLPSVPSSKIETVKKASELLLDLDINEPTPDPVPATQVNVGHAYSKSQNDGLGKVKSFGKTVQPQKTQSRPKPRAFEDDWDSFSDLPKQPAQSPPKKIVESSWDWDSVEPPATTKPKNLATKNHLPPTNAVPANEDASWDWDPVSVDTQAEPPAETEDGALPPVNIPPPSILLSAFPQLFEQANEYLYKPVSGQSQSIKERVLSDPKVYDFLKGYLLLAIVAARIIAGRKMRWHRDKFLSQSMSISAAGSKGMKLAGVNKSETTQEDREAADVVSNWKSQVGRLRSAVASANKGTGAQLKIPEISDNMQVQTAKDVPTAPKACVICGLKRNERLPKVDHEVEDSFGEWWLEHWGHVDCKRFWQQHENALRQR
ncbi:hypothetical protein F5B22DRAFT_582332 [Xylaria bambusicola]|uniref:uncharacterized protein n=1 Tax=Xylaria bambusicola TaxID=326684 RepID=UPI0020088449|nr:uncharacterized protein F5B22DRAFT_582332 [Xylaria bambusicola]KAI0527782.1 hypothetical protein F5B22DRAFT_582332 [Xylaria bambusicola]